MNFQKGSLTKGGSRGFDEGYYAFNNAAVSEIVTGLADPAANVIFGACVDERYEGEVHVTIIATGFAQSYQFDGFYSKEEEPLPWQRPAAPAAPKDKGRAFGIEGLGGRFL